MLRRNIVNSIQQYDNKNVRRAPESDETWG